MRELFTLHSNRDFGRTHGVGMPSRFLALLFIVVAAKTPLAAAQENTMPTEAGIRAATSVIPYNNNFFVVSNLSLWFLWAILLIVIVILFSLKRMLQERKSAPSRVGSTSEARSSADRMPAREGKPTRESKTAISTPPLVEPKKVVTIKVRKVSTRKTKSHASQS